MARLHTDGSRVSFLSIYCGNFDGFIEALRGSIAEDFQTRLADLFVRLVAEFFLQNQSGGLYPGRTLTRHGSSHLGLSRRLSFAEAVLGGRGRFRAADWFVFLRFNRFRTRAYSRGLATDRGGVFASQFIARLYFIASADRSFYRKPRRLLGLDAFRRGAGYRCGESGGE